MNMHAKSPIYPFVKYHNPLEFQLIILTQIKWFDFLILLFSLLFSKWAFFVNLNNKLWNLKWHNMLNLKLMIKQCIFYKKVTMF